MKILLASFFLGCLSWGQVSLLPEPLLNIPELPGSIENKIPHRHHKKINQVPLPDDTAVNYTEKNVSDLALILNSQFKKALAPLDLQAPACGDDELDSYILALQVAGNFSECARIAATCQGQTKTPRPFMLAGLCEASRFQYTQADYFFNFASDLSWNKSSDYMEALFHRASYSLLGHHEDKVDGILARIPNSTPEQQKMWKALLKRVGEIDTGDVKRDQIDQFLAVQIQTASESFKGLLISLQIRIAMRDFRYADSLKLLFTKSSEIKNPLHWYYLAYNTLYHGLDQNFAWSRKIYDVYNRYANPWMSFPLESNTYNYSEIYGSVCKNVLVQQSEGAEFNQIKSDLRTGLVTIPDALKRLDALAPNFNKKADYLTTYAGLVGLQGRQRDAFQIYWEAHKLCPYYNRANWGLAVQKRFAQYASRPDFAQLEAKIARELVGRVVPEAISSYIVNWNSLNSEVQRRVTFGSRIWLPYMESLKENQLYSYIKYAYDLLSDSPQLSDLKNMRIGGKNYPHDNRLWDDVRGVGGSMVVADLSEVFNAVQGDYNLLGHEVAHQFQYLMEMIYPTGLQCIVSQYTKAKAEKNFPDSYSSQNKEEHFAQGVTYYMVPTDSPARFGLNQTWVERNNLKQFNFVQSIDTARGDFSKINCL